VRFESSRDARQCDARHAARAARGARCSYWHAPATHVCPAAHAKPHTPQLVALVATFVSQPSEMFLLQSA
jgi:hypothetical protein